MIKPTIGRVVLVYRPGASDQFEPAQICYVWSATRINACGIGNDGQPFLLTALRLDQEIVVDPVKLPELADDDAFEPFACWMPYQKEQAAKHANPTSPLEPLPIK